MANKKISYSKNDIWFLCSALIIPAVQFIIFYITVNINSISLSFQKYTGLEFVGNGFATYKKVFVDLFTNKTMGIMLKNTFSMYFFSEIVLLLLVTVISYAIWKKVFAYRFFSIMLFLPSIISNVVFVMVARFLILNVFPKAFDNPDLVLLLNQYGHGFKTTLIFYCLISVGSKIVLLSGAMSSVDASVVEYSELDGMNAFHQFIYIVFPHVYPTLISLFMLGCATMFTNMGALLTFFGDNGGEMVRTIGYHIYLSTYKVNYTQYPVISALGIILTVFVLVYSFTIKKLLVKFGPSEE